MPVLISQKTLTSANPAVYGVVEYSSYRYGDYCYFDLDVIAWCNNGYRNNRWACRIWVNIPGEPEWVIEDNGTIKDVTSGTIGGTYYYYKIGLGIARNSGNIGVTVQFADTGGSYNWVVNRNWGTYSGSVSIILPSAPSVPSSINIPSSVAPDKVANISWGAASGGTNGVSGYRLAYSKNGGGNYDYIDVGNTTNYNLNLNTFGFVQGSVLKCSVQSYTTVNGVKFYSDWRYSNSTTTSFVAPSSPKNLQINVVGGGEAIPTATIKGQWAVPDSGGTNGVSGYAIQWLKNGSNYGAEIDIGNVLNRNITLNGTDYQPGDVISYKVRAYTIGQSNKYYSSQVTDGSIAIISDKYIWVSDNGGAFTKRKAFISINGGSFGEMKKEKLHII